MAFSTGKNNELMCLQFCRQLAQTHKFQNTLNSNEILKPLVHLRNITTYLYTYHLRYPPRVIRRDDLPLPFCVHVKENKQFSGNEQERAILKV